MGCIYFPAFSFSIEERKIKEKEGEKLGRNEKMGERQRGAQIERKKHRHVVMIGERDVHQ